MELSKEFRFEASHVLPDHPGKCANLHGHSWILTVRVKGPIDQETGMVVDYGDIKENVQPVIDDLDHAHLGAWESPLVIIKPGMCGHWTKAVQWLLTKFNPTSENLLVEIAKQLLKKGFVFSSLTLNETCTTACTLTWEEFNDLSRK